MFDRRLPVLPAAFAATCLLLSPVLAFRSGPIGGWNGSVASSGNCMSCHGSRAGSGSVTVSGAPASYSLSQTYQLTVRVADPDQLGAGFQISVEDAVGNHVGALIITDPVNTQLAPVNPAWVTHTSTGADNAVAGWAALGNAAEFHLQWQAPAVDVGEIMFFLAGNATNDDRQAFNGMDTIYLAAQSATAGDTCGDGEQNSGEAGIDCGGPCPACECLADADCDDEEDCTNDRCTANTCVNDTIPNCCATNADCDDGVFCNGAEACQANSCEPGAGPCPGQRCDEATAACVDCLTDADCDDGVFCNGTEACQADLCEPGTGPCLGQQCNEATAACVDCLTDADCDDGVFCNGAEACQADLCEPGAGPCLGQQCNEATAACVDCLTDADCDDGVFCNGAEACQADLCEPGAGPCLGQQCDEATHSCVDCRVDADCDDGNPCTDDACASGACIHDDNEVECDDGDACTTADQCVNGACTGFPVEPCCATNGECDDGDECTEDTCDTNACRHDPLPDCPASDDDEPSSGEDDMPDPLSGGSEQPLLDGNSPTPSLPRGAPCGLFGMITFPVLIFGLISIRSRRRNTTVGLRRRS